MKVNVTQPLDANDHDPWVERAMTVTAQMSPEQQDAFFRSLYRHISAYHESRDADPLAKYADSVIASVILHSDPGYTQAVEAFQAAQESGTGQRVDPQQLPLNPNDPQVERAMKTVAHLSPEARHEFIRTVYRYAYAYLRTPDPNLLIGLVNSVTAGVALRQDPNYAHAVQELAALTEALKDQPPVDFQQILATEHERHAD